MSPAPAHDRALKFLNSARLGALTTGSRRLPPIAKMAVLAGVSEGTMLRAVHTMVDWGMLRSRRKRGVEVLHSVTPDESASFPARMHQKRTALSAQLRTDIITGRCGADGALPSQKELCNQYGVAYATVHKALMALIREGILRRSGNRFEPVLAPQVNRAGVILFIARTKIVTFGNLMSELAEQQFSMLERLAAARGVAVRPILFYRSRGKLLSCGTSIKDGIRQSANVLGAVVQTDALSENAEGYHAILQTLRNAGNDMPIAVLHQSPSFELPATAFFPAHLVRPADNSRIGAALARHLLSKGHRHMAFLGRETNAWARARLDGAVQTVRDFNATATVTPFWAESTPGTERHAGHVRELGRRFNELAAAKKDLIAEDLLNDNLDIGVFRNEAITVGLKHEALFARLLPAFNRALRATHITAWMCENDTVALKALLFLRACDPKRAERIAVLGCDNGREAALRGLSSYDFDIESVAGGLLSLFTGPLARHKRPARLVIEGAVVERNSTARMHPTIH